MEDQTGNVPAGAQGAGGQQQAATLRVNDTNATTSYSNFAIVTSTPEEAVVNFGINLMIPNQEKEVRVDISNRVVMGYASAKRLAITLSNLIQRYEAANGVIDINPRPQQQAGGGAPGGADKPSNS